MQKLTVFFIGATVIVVIITGSILGYKFFTKASDEEESKETKQIVQEIPEEIPEVIKESRTEIESEPAETEKPEEAKEVDTAVLVETEEEPLDPFALASLKSWDLSDAGFTEAQLNYAPFNGTVFETIDISEYNDNDHVSYEILQAGEPQGTIDELIFPSEEITNEIYSILLQKITDDPNFTVNETNQYGDASFFANHSEDKNSVFLVVKIGLRMYTLHYPAKNHNKIKNLINILHG
jgi:hypothetical protein